MNLTRTIFPLRSNFGWFFNQDLYNILLERLKLTILLYDEIIIEDGTFQGYVLDEFGLSMYSQPGTVPYRDRFINLQDVGESNTQIWIQPGGCGPNNPVIPLTSGKTLSYKIDYCQLLESIDLNKHKFIQKLTLPDQYDFFPNFEKILEEQVQSDLKAIDNISEYPEYSKIDNTIIKGLNRDLMIASMLNSSLTVDPVHRRVLEQKSRLSSPKKPAVPDIRYLVGAKQFDFAVPNFEKLSLNEVIALRQDSEWMSFRSEIQKIAEEIETEPDVLLDDPYLDNLVSKVAGRHLFQELVESKKTGWLKVTPNWLFGLLSFVPPPLGPAIGALGLMRDIGVSTTEVVKNKSGWAAFLIKAQKLPGSGI